MYSATFLATIEKPVRDHLWKKKKKIMPINQKVVLWFVHFSKAVYLTL